MRRFGFTKIKGRDEKDRFIVIAQDSGDEHPTIKIETRFKDDAITEYDLSYSHHGLLWGACFKCGEFLDWAENYPTEFTMYVWEQIDNEYNLKSLFDLTFQGVKFDNIRCSSNGGTSACSGICNIKYDKKIVNENYHPMICKIPEDVKYPNLEIGKLVYQYKNLVQ